MTSSPAIRCVGLSRWYGEVQGLAGLDISIDSGVIGLLGPNGSGKSTLMRMLTGQIRPSRGFVELFGVRMGPDSHDTFRRVGYSPGEDVHFENERGIDFLKLLAGLQGEGGPAAIKRAEEALQKVSMSEYAGKKMSAMSKGMRQRIKVAQALLFEPELLLLDEPLNGMDPVSRRSLIDLVRNHATIGGTVLLASHVLHEVESVTNRVILLHHGRLLAEGRLGEIRELIGRKPRRVRLIGTSLRSIAGDVLSKELATGVSFEDTGALLIETRQLNELLLHLSDIGTKGGIQQFDVEDENLEAIFNLLVGDFSE
ncbi:MAG: ABC transporter ATP-binding protein [Planctomycetes bacterium]|jgi:ABC-2 type transport system ATP-binding protein|nr:ABC transporter ATP-binding protein [Planctomycetota bacterium]MBT4029550.1 ABC transporter ATP-binding protein [Planctomycetota bacterium]MBT4560580.1 ABC transporter ATP-binding protein [Planctomycetota bacterium]MBT5100818.1 ABC transporter ATP-binding protein [Planctomycetota bacterium]MBT5120754.1 ABC transporter ATP-binding protein [Planctomycetota bacterium]